MRTIRHNTATVRRAFRAMVGNELPKVVAAAARKVASDVVAETCAGISGDVGLPQRVDTGRYRAGWAMGALKIGKPARGVSTKGASSADATTAVRTGPTGTGVLVQNNVKYGWHVEHGTDRMEPGNHLLRALGVVAQGMPLKELKADLARDLAAAWKAA